MPRKTSEPKSKPAKATGRRLGASKPAKPKTKPRSRKAAAVVSGSIDGVQLAKGTVLRLADRDVTLEQDTFVTFAGMEREVVLVGMLHVSGGNNLEVNRPKLAGTYDGLGNPVAE